MVTMTAIGIIEEVRVNKRNVVKYLIRFKDDNGRVHTAWSNWTANRDHKPGTSIPIKYRLLSGTYGLGCTVTEIDDLPQFNEKLAQVGACALFIAAAAAGFTIAKLFDRD